MPKFTLIAEHDDGNKITSEFVNDYLYDVLENMDLFLRGVGFFYEGRLNVESEEFYRSYDETEELSGWAGQPAHSMGEFATPVEESKCSMCNISWATMADYTCYDKKCPRNEI